MIGCTCSRDPHTRHYLLRETKSVGLRTERRASRSQRRRPYFYDDHSTNFGAIFKKLQTDNGIVH